jgi:hypothetical protein
MRRILLVTLSAAVALVARASTPPPEERASLSKRQVAEMVKVSYAPTPSTDTLVVGVMLREDATGLVATHLVGDTAALRTAPTAVSRTAPLEVGARKPPNTAVRHADHIRSTTSRLSRPPNST